MFLLISRLVSMLILTSIAFNVLAANPSTTPAPEPYCRWEMKDFSIIQPICGLVGNKDRGKAIVINSNRGNCVACHRLPVEDVEAYGTLGPPLMDVGARYSTGFLRMRVVDTKQINPISIMPGFYRDPNLLHRPAKAYRGRTFLTAQQIEDVVAYLVSLK